MLYVHSALFILSLLAGCLLLPTDFAIGVSVLCLTQGWLFLRLSAPIQKSYFGGLAHLPSLLRTLTNNAHDYRLLMAASVRRLFRGYNSYALALIMFAIIWLCSRDILFARLELTHGLYAASLLFVLMNALLIGSVQKHPAWLAGVAVSALIGLCAYMIWMQDSCLVRAAYPPTEGLGTITALVFLSCGSGTDTLNFMSLLLFGGGFVSSLALLLALACFSLRASYSKLPYISICLLVFACVFMVAVTTYNAVLGTVAVALLATVTGLLWGGRVLGRSR